MLKIHKMKMEIEDEKRLTEYKLHFFTNISHEFRTPLTIIRGSIENLASQDGLPEQVGRQINILAKSSARLLRLIDQLLEFRCLQNNKMELKLEMTEAVGFFHDIYLAFKEMADRKDIEYLFESDESQYDMLLDKGNVDKIAYNLLSNAFKHTSDHGHITVKLVFSTQNDTLTLSVSDSGAGIPAEQQSSLFVGGKQFDYSSGGAGVGLHLTSELAAAHKGSIKYAESEFGGACLVVTIPLSEKNYEKDDVVPLPLSGKISAAVDVTEPGGNVEEYRESMHKDYKVLVIEDDEDVCEYIQPHLNRYFITSTAKNGLEGLDKAIDEQPNLIICDVIMPEMNGFEITRRLKNNFQTSHIPVIMLTAHSSGEQQMEEIQAGADAYITKPFSMKFLMMHITKLIERFEKLQQKLAQYPGLVRPSVKFSAKDKEFLDLLNNIIEENMTKPDFTVDSFAKMVGMGRTVFYNKVKGITGYSPNEYIRRIRLKKAADFLVSTDLNVSEVSYKVGINDPFYFSKCFKLQFGKSPSKYQKG
jgi:DNA-binding response OmpR family regulator/anti-sigma regulatory factor (Ser/Thr protein kinase)